MGILPSIDRLHKWCWIWITIHELMFQDKHFSYQCEAKVVGGDRGSETPTSRAFYSRFPPPSVGVPASLFYFCCEMLRNIAKCFFFSPGSRHFGNPASALSPLASRSLFSRAPAPLSPSTSSPTNCYSNVAPFIQSVYRVRKSVIFGLNRVSVWVAGLHLPSQGYVDYFPGGRMWWLYTVTNSN